MRNWKSQRGFLSFSSIFSLAVFAAMVVAALRVVPPFISNYQLQDSIENLAMTATYTPASEAEIAKSVISRAESLDITLNPNQVKVHKETGRSVNIEIHYTVVVELFVRTVELSFDPSTSNRNIVK